MISWRAVEELSIATLNIGSASEQRAIRLFDEWIAPTDCDVYVLTETTRGAGTSAIVAAFRASEWGVFHALADDRGVAIVSRVAARARRLPQGEPRPGRVLSIELETRPRVTVIGMYVPSRDASTASIARLEPFLDFWLEALRATAGEARLLAGDLNVVPPSQKPVEFPQMPFESEWFAALQREADFVDPSPEGHEPTWVTHRGEPYTYDYIIPSRNLEGRLTAYTIDHSPRTPVRYTDHSAVRAVLNVDQASFLHRRRAARAAQNSLF